MPYASTFVANQAPVSRRGEYLGLLSIGWGGAFIIAPTLGLRWAEAFGFYSLWILVGVLALISAIGIWMLRLWFKAPTPIKRQPVEVPIVDHLVASESTE